MKPCLAIAYLVMFVALAAPAGDSTTGVISTVAGNGTEGSSGDGGPATSAQLDRVADIAVDTAGNIYISGSNAIRKVSPDGVISTVVGNLGGDIAVDVAGNIYIIPDPFSGMVKITPTGAVIAVASPGSGEYFVGPVNDSAGNVYFAWVDWWFGGSLYKVNADGTVSFVRDLLGEMGGLVVDSAANAYISSDGVWKIDPQGSRTLSFYTNDSSFTSGLAVDSKGNLFISETGKTPRIWMVTPSGTTSAVAGNGTKGFSGDGGPATSAQLRSPVSLAIDHEGNLLIADSDNFRVRKVTWVTETFFAHVAVGGGYSTTVTLTNTGESAISGNLILTDSQGQPLTVSMPGVGVGSSFPVSIAPAGTAFLSINPVGPGDPLKTGWATLFTSGGVLNGGATYYLTSGGITQAVTGVLPSQPMQYATIPIDDDASQGRLTAYAIANPTSQDLVIKLALVNQDGQVVDDSATIALAPKQQIARHLNRDVARPQFKGSIVLRAQEGGSFLAMAVRYYQNLFTVIPVIPGKPSRVPD